MLANLSAIQTLAIQNEIRKFTYNFALLPNVLQIDILKMIALKALRDSMLFPSILKHGIDKDCIDFLREKLYIALSSTQKRFLEIFKPLLVTETDEDEEITTALKEERVEILKKLLCRTDGTKQYKNGDNRLFVLFKTALKTTYCEIKAMNIENLHEIISVVSYLTTATQNLPLDIYYFLENCVENENTMATIIPNKRVLMYFVYHYDEFKAHLVKPREPAFLEAWFYPHVIKQMSMNPKCCNSININNVDVEGTTSFHTYVDFEKAFELVQNVKINPSVQ